MTPQEITVSPDTSMPRGYIFLKKGIKYKTLHCRRLTHEAGKTVYRVEENKKVLGIRVPKSVFFHVQSLANETLSARRSATQQRDAALIRTAGAELDQQFPDIPKIDRDKVLNHGFRKYSGRVGRTSQIPMQRKVLLAVIAHVRHKHTNYDQLLCVGKTRDCARRAVQKKLQSILQQWGTTQDLTWYFHDAQDSPEEDAARYPNRI